VAGIGIHAKKPFHRGSSVSHLDQAGGQGMARETGPRFERFLPLSVCLSLSLSLVRSLVLWFPMD
jgi:hypothetical protein